MKRIIVIAFFFCAFTCQAGVNAAEVLKTAVQQVLMGRSGISGEMGTNDLYRSDTIHVPYLLRFVDTLTHYDDYLVDTYRPADRSRGDSVRFYFDLNRYKKSIYVQKIELFFPISDFRKFKRELDKHYLPETGLDMLWLERWNKRSSATYNRRSIHLTRDKNFLKITCTLYTIII